LLLYTHSEKNGPFYFFLIISSVTGFAVELIGTKTGMLFGSYSYGTVLGPALQNVPLIIGINWFIVIYCCGITINTILSRLVERLAEQTGTQKRVIKAASIIIDGATLAVFFDWIMEPVAMKLGYWNWNGSEIPLYNYVCWFVVSAALLWVFQFARFNKQNKFAVNLLLIQMMFFLLLRTFL
jgi:putative membrane protein